MKQKGIVFVCRKHGVQKFNQFGSATFYLECGCHWAAEYKNGNLVLKHYPHKKG